MMVVIIHVSFIQGLSYECQGLISRSVDGNNVNEQPFFLFFFLESMRVLKALNREIFRKMIRKIAIARASLSIE